MCPFSVVLFYRLHDLIWAHNNEGRSVFDNRFANGEEIGYNIKRQMK